MRGVIREKSCLLNVKKICLLHFSGQSAYHNSCLTLAIQLGTMMAVILLKIHAVQAWHRARADVLLGDNSVCSDVGQGFTSELASPLAAPVLQHFVDNGQPRIICSFLQTYRYALSTRKNSAKVVMLITLSVVIKVSRVLFNTTRCTLRHLRRKNELRLCLKVEHVDTSMSYR